MEALHTTHAMALADAAVAARDSLRKRVDELVGPAGKTAQAEAEAQRLREAVSRLKVRRFTDTVYPIRI